MRDHPAQALFDAAKYRARKAGIEFTITVEDIIVPERCPLLGVPIVLGAERHAANNAPSVDRRNPKFGYVPGNVWVISWRANAIKRDATLEELELITANLRLVMPAEP